MAVNPMAAVNPLANTINTRKPITLTLTFSTEAEIQLYESLENDAAKDERPLTVYARS